MRQSQDACAAAWEDSGVDMRSALPEIAEVLGKETRGEIDGAEVDVPVKGGEVFKGGEVLSAMS